MGLHRRVEERQVLPAGCAPGGPERDHGGPAAEFAQAEPATVQAGDRHRRRRPARGGVGGLRGGGRLPRRQLRRRDPGQPGDSGGIISAAFEGVAATDELKQAVDSLLASG
jgi:hypothetical protein